MSAAACFLAAAEAEYPADNAMDADQPACDRRRCRRLALSVRRTYDGGAMIKLSIVGEGEFKATLAQKAAAADWPAEILLLDAEKGSAQGKALDLLQSNPMLGSGTGVTGAQDLSLLDGSRYIVVGDFGIPLTDEPERAVVDALCAAIRDMHRKPVVLVSQIQPARLMRRICESSRLPPDQIIGTSPIALASTYRLHAGGELRCSPRDVQLSLIGAPPEEGLYEVCAAVGGEPLADLLTVAELRSVSRRAEGH